MRKRRKWLYLLLLVTLLQTNILPSHVLAIPQISVSKNGQINKKSVSDTQELILDQIKESQLENEGETDDSDQPPTFTDEEIMQMSWGQLTPEVAKEFYHLKERNALLIAAQFYSELHIFLSEDEVIKVLEWNDEESFQVMESLPEEYQNRIFELAPPIRYLKEASESRKREELEEQSTLQPARSKTPKTNTATDVEVKYSEKNMQHVFTKNLSFDPVDDLYTSGNLVEADLHLQGKHGMDLILQRQYNSLNSKTRRPTLFYNEERNQWENTLEEYDHKYDYVPFATGWSFNIPTFEYEDSIAYPEQDPDDDDKIYKYETVQDPNFFRYSIHLDDGRTLIYNGEKGGPDEGFVNYPYKDADLELSEDPKDITLYIGGYKYHFVDDGNEMNVTKENPYGDTITYSMYKYRDNIGDNDRGSDEGNLVAVTIIDTFKRKIEFERDLSEQGGKFYPIRFMKVYNPAESTPIKQIEYSNFCDSFGCGLSAVWEGIDSEKKITAVYEYDLRHTEFNLISEYTLPERIDDNFESTDYLEMDNNTSINKLDYRLLLSVKYPNTGLSIYYDYTAFTEERDKYDCDKNGENCKIKDGYKPQRMDDRKVVRLYQDSNILSYITYHPITSVKYVYQPYGTNEQQILIDKGYEKKRIVNDPFAYKLEEIKSWEMWKEAPVERSRLKRADYRHGNEVNTQEKSIGKRLIVEQNFKADSKGNYLLNYSRTIIDRQSPNLQVTTEETEESYTFDPIECVSYAYKEGAMKPSYKFEFLGKVPDQAVYVYLINPKLNGDGKYDLNQTVANKISKFANVTEYDYNDSGNLTEEKSPDGVITTLDYYDYPVFGGSGVFQPLKLSKISSPEGLEKQQEYIYDPQSLLLETEVTSQTDPKTNNLVEKMKQEYEYNTNSLPSRIIVTGSGSDLSDPKNTLEVTIDSYDSFGHATQKTYKNVQLDKENPPEDLITKYKYKDGLDLLDHMIFPDQSQVEYSYDQIGRITDEIFTNKKDGKLYKKKSKYSYGMPEVPFLINRKWNVVINSEARKVTKTVTVVEKGIEYPINAKDKMELVNYYTPMGDLEYSKQLIGGVSRTLIRNEFETGWDGRKIKNSHPYGLSARKTSYTYYPDGSLRFIINPLGERIVYNYANAMQTASGDYVPASAQEEVVKKDNQSAGTLRSIIYSDRNQRVIRTEQIANTQDRKRASTMDYDGFGRLTNKKDIGYQEKIDPTSSESTLEEVTRDYEYHYDLSNNLIHLKDPENNQYNYEYDGFGNLVQIKEGGQLTSKSYYNALSWKLQDEYPDNQIESYKYYNTGDVHVLEDKSGSKHEYSYTPFYELDTLSIEQAPKPGETPATFSTKTQYYEHTRLVKKQSSSDGPSIEYEYDSFNRMNKYTVLNRTYTLGYKDSSGGVDDLIDTFTYHDGPTVTYQYDNLNRLKEVSSPVLDGPITYDRQLTDDGFIKNTHYPQAMGMEQQSNPFGEIQSTNHLNNNEENNVQWMDYQAHDGFGNIERMNQNGAEYSYQYYLNDRIKSEERMYSDEAKIEYKYNERGNREKWVRPATSFKDNVKLTYDLLNRLQTVEVSNDTESLSGSYEYYPDGLRSKKVLEKQPNKKETTQYIYLNGRVVEELNEEGEVKARNIWGNELVHRTVIDNTTNTEKDGYYYYNSHGDVISIKDKNGIELNSYQYDIWGNIQSESEQLDNPFKYSGEIYDPETKLYYLRARYYDPSVGRFITEDTYKGQVDNPLSLNRYTYVENNPVNYIDPSGLYKIKTGFSLSQGYRLYEFTAEELKQRAEDKKWNRIINGLEKGIGGPRRIIKDIVEAAQGYEEVGEDLAERAEKIHSQYKVNPYKMPKKGVGNLGIAWIDIDGLPSEIIAHSKFNDKEGFANLKDSSLRMFLTEFTDGYQRALDAESKILEEIALQLGNDFSAHGTINLYTEGYPCVSCYGVIEQFRSRYQNITLEIFYGDGYWAKELSNQNFD